MSIPATAFQRPITGRQTASVPVSTSAEPKPDKLMRAVALMLFTYVWRLQDAFPILGKMQLPAIALLAALMYYLSNKQPSRRLRLIRGPTWNLVVALTVIMAIGVPFSLWVGHSATFVLKGMLPNVFFLLLVATSVRSIRDIEWYALVNLYGALVYTTVISLFFRVGYDGRLGGLIFYDANDFALVMVCTIPFAVYFLSKGQRRSRRIAALATMAMILTAMVKSGSRGGFIGLIAVMLYVLLRYRAIPSRVRLAVTIAGVALFLGFASDKYWTSMGTILHPQSDYNYNDNVGRVEVWKRGLGYVVHNPVVGVGVSAYSVAEGGSDLARSLAAAGKGFKWSVAHNSFLETAAELGVVGGLTFIAILISTAYGLTRLSPRGKWARWISRREMALAQMLIGALVGFSVAGFFVSAEYFAYLYFILGLSVGLTKIVRLRATSSPAQRPQINVRLATRAPVPTDTNLDWVRSSIETSLGGAPTKR
ncbi:MAG TPA: O-antigen ligase family protein [Gemmatimonadaceae bacterium]|nr:O-antigen ligase family protein [Gemmatimonadaceae bacterium]